MVVVVVQRGQMATAAMAELPRQTLVAAAAAAVVAEPPVRSPWVTMAPVAERIISEVVQGLELPETEEPGPPAAAVLEPP
jgi:hypothetical protein